MKELVQFEEWTMIFPTVGTIILFCVFLVVCWKVLGMDSKNIEKMENLPLEDNPEEEQKR